MSYLLLLCISCNRKPSSDVDCFEQRERNQFQTFHGIYMVFSKSDKVMSNIQKYQKVLSIYGTMLGNDIPSSGLASQLQE